ncbi:MAG TPA: hypothetical protein VFZ16_17650 [Hyphomicrobiaceae bacterium]|nr:hypothetical protein [Hyphomicrobiaceae bacterium]
MLIVGAAAAVHGFAAPPLKLDEIRWRLGKNLLLLGGLFLAIYLLWIAVLLISPVASFLTLMIPSLVVVPLVCCWLFGLAWRLGYDLGLLSAHICAGAGSLDAKRKEDEFLLPPKAGADRVRTLRLAQTGQGQYGHTRWRGVVGLGETHPHDLRTFYRTT